MSLPWITLMSAMRKGAMLADPETWKQRQVLINTVGGLVVAGYSLARALGWITWDIDSGTLADVGMALGAALYSVANIILTVGTTTKIGLASTGPVSVEAAVLVRDATGGLRLPDGSTAPGAVPTHAGGAGPGADRAVPNPFLDG